MARVFLGIGSNEGDRLEAISRAVQMLGAVSGIRVVQLALISETAPVGGPEQGPYLNTVLEVETTLEPHALLGSLQAIERRLGRTPSPERWGPRPIDLDVLLYGDRVLEEPRLTIPHPRMPARRFVLEPLAQLAPEVRHPVLDESVAELLKRLTDAQEGAREAHLHSLK